MTNSSRRAPRLTRRVRTTIAGVAAVFALWAGAAPALAVDTPVGMSVSITNSVAEATADSTMDYVTVLENSGPEPVDLRLVVTVPGYATIAAAPDATIDEHSATWAVTVEPGAPQTMTTSAVLTSIPAETLWVNVTADVFVEESQSAVIGSAAVTPVVGTEKARADAATASEQHFAAEAAATGVSGFFASPTTVIAVIIVAGVLAIALTVASILLRRMNRERARLAGDAGASLQPRTVDAPERQQ
ncbi:hypothetical protein [Glaciibacter psychrotolerans]|uniref:DUF11 domain-containing protein n=1 Tax=Glaciibacter psychrotolerans TaxID=670054 RepID=A0A7Z0J6W9_9MICO|nr:hypothetical protein [Leifsonia psychrotolerans]NYJ20631.1 hypothetical protein [Leifsonia psychrotolerans]